jgi:hypothetical protein
VSPGSNPDITDARFTEAPATKAHGSCSQEHAAEHPSPMMVFPSSHCSPAPRIPSPQYARVVSKTAEQRKRETSATTLCFGMDHAPWGPGPVPPVAGMSDEEMPQVPCPCVRRVCRRTLESVFKTRSGMNRRAGRAILLPVPPGSGTHALLLRRERGRVWAVYYRQIRKSEQRPPLHLRAADLVPVCGRFVTNSPHTPRPTARTPEKCVCGRPRRHPGPEKCFLSPPPVVYCTNFRARFEIFIFGFSQVIYY